METGHALDCTSAATLMARGAEALHGHVVGRIEAAMCRPLPQMEVRFSNLSISAQLTVLATSNDANPNLNPNPATTTRRELPTVTNALKAGLRGLLPNNTRTVTKPILRNISGVFKPGTMTLVLGQPGSGKSSLLKLLSGRFPESKDIHVAGDIMYNGMDRADLATRLPQFVSYVSQQDMHFPKLSVKETLAFAHACSGGHTLSVDINQTLRAGSESEYESARVVTQALRTHQSAVVLQQLGLENCQDTIVGDAVQRGISGGERKRVTTGEMLFGDKYVYLLDEISTGLDSAATYDIIKTQRSIATTLRKTIIISLLQPAPEVFALFDEVLLLNKGHVMYYGPREDILAYFTGLGFCCSPDRDVADFLLDLGTDQQAHHEIAKTTEPARPRKAHEFAERFALSEMHQRTKEQLYCPHDPLLLHDMHHFGSVPEFHQSFWPSTWSLTQRELKVALRNTEFLQGRAALIFTMGFMFSSLFYQVNPTDVQVVIGALFPILLVLALVQGTQIAVFMDAREIYYKQRRANFYRTSSYALASSISQLPIALVETVVYGSVVYWFCGFVADLGAFAVFELVLLATHVTFSAWFFLVAAVSPNIHIAEPVGMLSLLFYILFAGFMISQHEIPVYFTWAYWLNPIAWALRSLAINQYRRDEFDQCVYDGIEYCTKYNKTMSVFSLETFQIQTERYWLWYGIQFMVVSYMVFIALSIYALENVRYESPEETGGVKHDEYEEMESDVVLVRSCSINEIGYGVLETPRPVPTAGAVMLEIQPSIRDCYFEPVTLAFKELWYSVPSPDKAQDLDLLKVISGFALPGTITALMGSSGAGKTTLMDVIAHRKSRGTIRGDILLNGYPATKLAIQRVTGYCEQTDVHSNGSTFREALVFSAFLRLGSNVPNRKKYDSVEDCLDLLDLRPIADQIIRGSSSEQLKRLTIGVELAAQPSVLFLDEPTSGLDARSAKLIMDGVRKVAYTGRTVVCTIHQPSQEVFQLFDSLLLLKRGGETVFFGEMGIDAKEMTDYFRSIPGTPRLEQGCNPGTWMLEIIGAGVDNSNSETTDFVAEFNASEHKVVQDGRLHRASCPVSGVDSLTFQSKRASSEWTQAKFVVLRFFNLYWRTASYTLTRMVLSMLLALVFGLSFAGADYGTYQGINSGMGMLFTAIVFSGVVAFDSVISIALEDRSAFYRERASQTYNAFWYFVGATVAEVPYVIAVTFLFTAIFYPIVGLSGFGHFLFFWINMAFHVLLQVYIGQFLAYAFSSLEVATAIGVLITSVSFLFMGFNPPASYIPAGYKWLHHIVPPKYTMAILAAIVFGECSEPDGDELGCKQLANVPPPLRADMTVQEYVTEVFSARHEEIGLNFMVILAYIVLFRVMGLLALRFVSRQ